MPDKKISALTAASALTGAELLPVVQSGTTKKATIDQIRDFIQLEVDLDEVVTNGNTYAGTMIKATTSNNNALTVVNSYMNVGAGDSSDLDGSANRYGYEIFNSGATYNAHNTLIGDGTDTIFIERAIDTGVSRFDIVATNANFPGIKYGSDWSANFTNRSLIDKGYANLTYAPKASPTFTGTVTTPAIIVSSETASRIAIIDASKNVKSGDTATYPSLTEIAYVKGVTSAIQTQLNLLAPLASPTFTGTPLLPTGTTGVTQSANDNSTKLATTAYADLKLAKASNLSDLASAATARANLGAPVTFLLLSAALSPNDSTTYYFGIAGNAPNTTDSNFPFSLGYAFTIIGVTIQVAGNTVSGTTENSTLQIRNITQATSTSVGTFTTNASATLGINKSFTGLNISVAAGDSFCAQIDTPAWVTNPTTARFYCFITAIRA